MLIYGHRGASAVEPENTIRAFKRAIDMGVDGLEIDIHVSADRVPVILHDRELARTTNGSGAVDKTPLAELRALDAGKNERIPTLDEVLELAGDRIHFDIEIKQGGIEREVLAALTRHPVARWAISSFDWTTLERTRELSTEATLWLLADRVSDALFHAARRSNASGVSLGHAALDATSARRLQEANLDIIVWTVNDVDEAIHVRDLGTFGLCTDTPDVIKAGLDKPTQG